MVLNKLQMGESYKSKILDEIKKTGFPTELEVSKIFLENKFYPNYNAYYIDKDEMKGREIDLICDYFYSTNKNDHDFELVFKQIVEVKFESDRPWVVFSTKPNAFERAIGVPKNIISSNFDKSKLLTLLRSEYQRLNPIIGRSGIEMLKGNRDKLFASVSGITKAIYHSMESSHINNDNSEDRLFELYEPLIVLKGTLIEASLDKENEICIEEKDYIQLKFNYISPNYPSNNTGQIIHIVKFDYLDTYLKIKVGQFENIIHEIVTNYS
jgi:hypothetical protein